MLSLKLSKSSLNNLSDYERMRFENIKLVREQLGLVYPEVEKSAVGNFSTSDKENNEQKKNSLTLRPKVFKRSKKSTEVKLVRRSARICSETKNYNEESNNDYGNKKLKKGSFIVKFPWCQSEERKEQDSKFYKALTDEDFFTDDEYESEFIPKKRRRTTNSGHITIPASQITEEMINNIHFSSSGKVYNTNGTTCHQCRQKTLDQKSYCRHKKCRGIRGFFCGYCLGKRYGENVADVLLIQKWACPPCRGYCNCSICRRREGKEPTGQMAPIAQAQGFKSVRHMLVETEGEHQTTLTSDDEEIQEEEEEDEEKEQLVTTMFGGNETSREKPDDVVVASVNSKSDISSRKSKPDQKSGFCLHFGYEFNHDEIFFEDYCKFPK